MKYYECIKNGKGLYVPVERTGQVSSPNHFQSLQDALDWCDLENLTIVTRRGY